MADPLIREAQLLATGANIHTINEAIAWYRGAMNSPGQEEWQQQAKTNLESVITQARSQRFQLKGRS